MHMLVPRTVRICACIACRALLCMFLSRRSLGFDPARASAPCFPDGPRRARGRSTTRTLGRSCAPPSQAQGCRPCSPPMGSLGMFSLDSCYWCGRVVQPRCYNCWAVEMTPCDTCEEGYPEGRGGLGLLVRTLGHKGIPASVVSKIVVTMCGTMADDVRPGARRWHLSCVLRSMRCSPPSPFLLLAAQPGFISRYEEWQTCFHLIFLFLGEKW